jgi:uncharacterized protein YhbP (UPF0306 family)
MRIMLSMAVRRIAKHPSARRIVAMTRRLLDQSTLCAIATVSSASRAYVNTAYFAWSDRFDIVWLSAPEAHHSRNIHANPSAAVAVYDSTQPWGKSDRGMQLFGRARELRGRDAAAARRLYAARFKAFQSDLDAYRFYRLRPSRIKLFDEHALGGATWVTVAVGADGRLRWVTTETYL